jgi:pyridoxal 5'-phosphate synthase pdxT subunit
VTAHRTSALPNGGGRPRIGVLALQGGFSEHEDALRASGAVAVQVRTIPELDGLDGLVIPGGESTTLRIVARDTGLMEALRDAVDAGLPVLGTCAGLIALSNAIVDGDRPLVGGLDITVRRNAYGRQVASFEALLESDVAGEPPIDAVFIRAPQIARTGSRVEILARHNGMPVAVRQGNLVGTAFHPELTDDRRFHEWLVIAARAWREHAQTLRGEERRVGTQ